jgi:hypothetical protein
MLTPQLLEEIEAGQGEPLVRAARRIPPYRQNKPVTISCLVRWILSGVRGPGGKKVHLEAARLAGRWITTPGALSRFVEAQTLCHDTKPMPAPRTPGKRRRDTERAEQELKNIGI